jgi:superfamily II DNA or RNA helicase
MNQQKRSSGSKFQWKPAKAPCAGAKADMKALNADTKAPNALANATANTTAKFASKKAAIEPPIIFDKTLQTYLGPRGYTLMKSDLSPANLDALRKQLTVRPVSSGAAFGPADTVEYPIYRESPNKLYLPRFFGIREFGPVKRMAIPEGHDIDVPFAGSLRPIQVPVVEAYMNAVRPVDNPGLDTGGGGLLELPCAFGKTVLSLKIIAELKKKTLVIVNKEFLLNQWIERIQQFLPTARVGKIQGPEIDIENKDIVLGMLQSISQKDYEATVFDSFGLTIIDEVHHISSEVFSRALFKIVSKYMLGLSATMERKDGTTYVFKQFLGEVVFKGERDGGEHDVEVRAIEYISKDAEFNQVECDFRGNPKYSTMIVKLCDHTDRSDFIVRVIRDLIKEQPGAQIMILAHNRSILTYLHDSILHHKIATAGYYVGGMKEASLKETEEKQVVVATYAMAAEALDIKTLNTLVMVTPKTDIVQSVGRILREKHDKPLVVDIVDKHDVFKNQWAKRRRYYKKCEYTIRSIDSTRYTGFSEMNAWKMVYKSVKCGIKPEISVESSDNESDNESDTKKKKTGPQKCMVVLEPDDEV